MLVVIGIFSVLAVLITQSLTVALVGSRKSDATVKVRENLEYAMSVLERRVRNAKTCDPLSPAGSVSFTDINDKSFVISCIANPANGSIALDGDKLTGDEITVTACALTCYPAAGGSPPKVLLSFTAQAVSALSADPNPVSISNTISLRVY